MKSINKYSSMLLIFALAIAFGATINSATAQDNTVMEVVESSEDHTIFAELLNDSGLSEAISDQGPYTIIAPTNSAFEGLDEDLEEIKSDPDRVESIVIGHLFQGEVQASDAEPALGIEITEGDIQASNGLVHVSSEVIQNN